MSPPEGTIQDITGHPLGGIYQLHFKEGDVIHLDSGIGARTLAQVYGGLQAAIGKRIYYETDDLGVMSLFVPLEEADG